MQPRIGDWFVFIPNENIWFEIVSIQGDNCVGFWNIDRDNRVEYIISGFINSFRLEQSKSSSFNELYDDIMRSRDDRYWYRLEQINESLGVFSLWKGDEIQRDWL